MRTVLRIMLATTPVFMFIWAVSGQTPAGPRPLAEEYSCTLCHADTEMFFGDQKHLLVTEKDLNDDIHWQKGLHCHDCHGGSPDQAQFEDHRKDPSYHKSGSPVNVPVFCGRCHSDVEYMKRYQLSPRIDQEREYWTSGHGQKLKADGGPDVATCVSCHGRHGTRAVDDPESPVNPAHLAKTCAVCHSDKRIAGETPMKEHHRFEGVGLPGCGACHSSHNASTASAMVEIAEGEACVDCHSKKKDKKLWRDWTKGGHKGVACEACHGPAGDHALPDVDPRPTMAVTSQMLAKPHDLCMVCHGKMPERQTTVSQIECEKHLADFKIKKGEPDYEESRQCLSCHDAHRPVKN